MLSRKNLIERYLDKHPELSEAELATKISAHAEVDVKKATLRRDIRRVKGMIEDREKHLKPLREEIERLEEENQYLRDKCAEEQEQRKEAEKEAESLESELEELKAKEESKSIIGDLLS